MPLGALIAPPPAVAVVGVHLEEDFERQLGVLAVAFAEEGLAALFVSHPPVGERVRRLRELDPNWREKLRAA